MESSLQHFGTLQQPDLLYIHINNGFFEDFLRKIAPIKLKQLLVVPMADNGNLMAQYYLGSLYSRSFSKKEEKYSNIYQFRETIPQDNSKAIHYFNMVLRNRMLTPEMHVTVKKKLEKLAELDSSQTLEACSTCCC
jgi:hypothetical protein